MLLIGFLPVTAKGQALIALLFGDKIQSDKVQLGLILGAQGSAILDAKTVAFRPNISLAFGAYVDVKIDKKNKWILQNYILFKAPKGASGLCAKCQSFAAVAPIVVDNYDMIKRKLTYLQLTPVMRYCFIPTLNLGIGPYVGFLMFANDTYSNKGDRGKETYKIKVNKNIATVDFGLAFDLQCRLLKGKGMQINLRYEQGLINTYRSVTGMKGLNMAFQVGVGIPMLSKSQKEENKELKQEMKQEKKQKKEHKKEQKVSK
jgi:hypothetical protein